MRTILKDLFRVIIDPIDGTYNLTIGKDNWCTAGAVIIDNMVRLGVIFEPKRSMVYVGMLTGDPNNLGCVAKCWDIRQPDQVIDLVDKAKRKAPRRLEQAAVGYHLTSNKKKRQEFYPFQETLINATCRTYQENCGLVSLRQVATKNLSAFVNFHAHP